MKPWTIPTLTEAILDRLVHNAHHIQLTEDSMRKVYGQQALNQDKIN